MNIAAINMPCTYCLVHIYMHFCWGFNKNDLEFSVFGIHALLIKCSTHILFFFSVSYILLT